METSRTTLLVWTPCASVVRLARSPARSLGDTSAAFSELTEPKVDASETLPGVVTTISVDVNVNVVVFVVVIVVVVAPSVAVTNPELVPSEAVIRVELCVVVCVEFRVGVCVEFCAEHSMNWKTSSEHTNSERMVAFDRGKMRRLLHYKQLSFVLTPTPNLFLDLCQREQSAADPQMLTQPQFTRIQLRVGLNTFDFVHRVQPSHR